MGFSRHRNATERRREPDSPPPSGIVLGGFPTWSLHSLRFRRSFGVPESLRLSGPARLRKKFRDTHSRGAPAHHNNKRHHKVNLQK